MAAGPDRSARVLLGLAAGAVGFAAADTYVVVLALPDMMASVGLSAEQLQRAAPIVSGFLLGYVAMLPLIGRIADLRGRTPVLVASLVLFCVGSLVTAAAYDLPSLVVGRFVQGVGGGGLVPVTLALVADLYPPHRRGVPLGIVGAVQELGSVIGPLFGAVVLAFGDWRDIFWLNLAVGLVLAAAVRGLAPGLPGHRDDPEQPARGPRRVPDLVGLALLAATVVGVLLVMRQPRPLTTSVQWGGPFVPFTDGGSIWVSPLGLATVVVGVGFLAWCALARRPLVDLRRWGAAAREADLVGAGLLAVTLGGVILAFATADPEVQVFSPAGPYYLGGAAVALVLMVVHQRRARDPLLPHGAFTARPAWGALVVSFFVGSALIAALVDIPVFARLTVASGSQLQAALVLVEFLVALPIGALLGGYLVRRLPAGPIAGAGMLLAAVGFVAMSQWGPQSLESAWSVVVLAGTGLGFGVAIAPVNAALLAATAPAVHGVASALLVVARMVGMLVGISALTTIGLRRYYAQQSEVPSPNEVCGGISTRCAEYSALVEQAGLAQLTTIFAGAAVLAVIAAGLSLALLRQPRSEAPSAVGARAHPVG